MGRSSGAGRTELLRLRLEEAWTARRDRIAGLTDDAYLGEPVPGCWTVRADDDGRWVTDDAIPDPDPAPLTTIAWRLVHVAGRLPARPLPVARPQGVTREARASRWPSGSRKKAIHSSAPAGPKVPSSSRWTSCGPWSKATPRSPSSRWARWMSSAAR